MRGRRRAAAAVLTVWSVTLAVPAARGDVPTTDLGAPYSFEINVAGDNGVGRITEPGLDCPDGDGAYRHYGIEAPIAAGGFSLLPGTLRGTLDVHDGPFLLAAGSHVTLGNERGTLRLTLTGGSCTTLPAVQGSVPPGSRCRWTADCSSPSPGRSCWRRGRIDCWPGPLTEPATRVPSSSGW